MATTTTTTLANAAAEIERMIDASAGLYSGPTLDLRGNADAQAILDEVLCYADDVTSNEWAPGVITHDCWVTREDGEGCRILVLTDAE